MIEVFRHSHRLGRDKRMTTHCALTARALGATRMIYSGKKDKKMEKNIKETVDRWGGEFEIKYEREWKKYLKEFDGKRIYLAMFGLPIEEKIKEIRNFKKDVLVVVGGEKVPGEIYEHIDLQIAVTNQPHSEVAALAVFLDKLQKGQELKNEFEDAEIEVVPQKKGKEIEDSEKKK